MANTFGKDHEQVGAADAPRAVHLHVDDDALQARVMPRATRGSNGGRGDEPQGSDDPGVP